MLYLTIGTIIVFVVTAVFLVAPILGGPIFYPTGTKHLKTMFDFIDFKKNMTLYDLGSGDGRIVRYFAARGVKANGIDINPLLVWYSRIVAKIQRISHATFRVGNIWNTNLSHADVVVLFLLPNLMEQITDKLRNEVAPGTQVLCYAFRLRGIEPVAKKDGVYKYVF